MINFKEEKLDIECYSIAMSFYDLLKSAAKDYNTDYSVKLNGYGGYFFRCVEGFTEVFKDAEEKRQSLSDETLYNAPVKDILKTLENHGLIFDKNILIEYGSKFKTRGYLKEYTYYCYLKGLTLSSLVDSLFRLEKFKNLNSIYRFLKSLANHIFNSCVKIVKGREIDELNETIQTFKGVLNKFNDLDKKIKKNSNTVFYGKPLKIILNDLRKLGLIVDKSSVGFKTRLGSVINIYEHIEKIIDTTEDFLKIAKSCYKKPLNKEAQKSLEEGVKRLIFCKHIPSLYEIML